MRVIVLRSAPFKMIRLDAMKWVSIGATWYKKSLHEQTLGQADGAPRSSLFEACPSEGEEAEMLKSERNAMTQRMMSGGLAIALTVGALTTATAGTLEAPSVVTTDVGAPDRAGIKEDEWRFTVGGGLAVAPDYEGSDDYKLVPIPTAIAKKGHYRVRLFGLYVESNVLDHPNWRLGPSANYRSGYNNVENNDVQHLKNRGGSFELGAKGGYQYYIGKSSLGGYLQFLHDVSDGHDGYLISPSIEYAAPLAPSWSVVMQGNTTYASGDYMSHYFSVNQRESARTGIDTNNADADFKDVTFNVGFVYNITQSWNLSLLGQYKRLVGDAADSPVVDDEGDKNNFAGGFTVTYTW